MEKIRLRHGDHEIELEGSKEFIEKHLASFYDRLDSLPMATVAHLKKEILDTSSKKPSGKASTPAEYYKSKGKTDGVSQVLIFGKYLEEYRSISEFSQRDINTLAKEAKLSKDIHGQYFTNAVKQGLLRSHGKGRYSLTLSAESALSAM